MINSDRHQLQLTGWLETNNLSSYCSSLRLQKYLFLYEAFGKADGENVSFNGLKGYERGPVFSQVWGDYTYNNIEFSKKALEAYRENPALINNKRAKIASFITSIMSEGELSELTHQFNIWNSKEKRILNGERQVPLSSRDFSESDVSLAKTLEDMYPEVLIDNSEIIQIDGFYFIFSKTDFARYSTEHEDILSEAARSGHLENPTYVEINSQGGLLLD